MRRSKQKYFFCFSSFSLIYFVFFDRLIMADQIPIFEHDAKSCFLDFIEGAERRLVELLGVAKDLSDRNILGGYLRDSFEDGRINCGRPLDSSSPLLVILKLLQRTTTICDRGELEELFVKLDQLLQFINCHEIHILFGALRFEERTGDFEFNPVCQSFDSWLDYAGNSSLFGSVLKATWARCIVGDIAFCKTHFTLSTLMKDKMVAKQLSKFTSFFQTVHFAPVFLCKHCSFIPPN